MGNKKQQLWKYILVTSILSILLFSGCVKEDIPQKTVVLDNNNQSTIIENSSISDKINSEIEKEIENSSPSKKVMDQVISEWKEMYASFYDYQDCSAILSERIENDGTIEEIFIVGITYISEQPGSDESEHFIADMKAIYPINNPEEITLWMDNSGGAMTDLILFKEYGPG